MNENQPTTRQLVLFAVVLSFVVSIIGTVLSLGILGPLFETGNDSSPFFFNRPKVLERITEIITKPTERLLDKEETVVNVVEQASPAVVSVVASKDVPVIERFFIDPFSDDPFFKQFFGDSGFRVPQFRQKGTQRQEVSAGTGFIVSADGFVVTNKHVVSDTQAEFTVLFNDGRKMKAKILAKDPLQDLAVLKIEGNDFPFLKLGDSNRVKIGQSVIAIGNALGEFRNTVSTGIVSGLQRSIVASGGSSGPENLQELIQTDAAINPGNSGGPLLNLSGEVIGVNTAVASGAENIGFSIPINKLKRNITSVQKQGKIVYPFLGVRYVLITKEMAEKEKLDRDYGAMIRSTEGEKAVVPESPAAKAGLKDGDIVLKINNEVIGPNNTLAAIVQKYQVGDEITLLVFREGKEQEM
ncbi:MAG: trypsin-like peptidase domain-containing protein, partial [bacterium]|nr:trypsin-like peptidase domain-containing protein [bacterium]